MQWGVILLLGLIPAFVKIKPNQYSTELSRRIPNKQLRKALAKILITRMFIYLMQSLYFYTFIGKC